ncbi:MAG: hypothetical protein ABIQ93_10710 [Saprospiraceae bacterium]
MKHLFLAALLLLTACMQSKPTADDNRGGVNGLVPVKVWNNSLLPHHYVLIGYNPGERGNWTNGVFLLPGTYHTFRCPVGTKIYRANRKQVGTVMGGGSIYKDQPLIAVKAEDAGKSFRLNR